MTNFNYPELGTREQFNLNLSRLNQALQINSNAGPVSPVGMGSILGLAAQVTGYPLEFFETVLELEADYPNRKVYSSALPRNGDANKRLPDPRYPHPSAWSARPGAKYEKLAKVNSGTQIYLGVSQISFEFWQDVKDEFLRLGVERQYLPAKWWEAPLLIQVIAPLVYFKLYGSKYPRGTLVTPATVYMLHQQGPGWAASGLKQLAGNQSDKTFAVVRAARQASKGYI